MYSFAELYRKKAIGLDDLLSDFCGGKRKTVKKFVEDCEANKRVAQNETYLHKFFEDCEKQASVNFLPFFSHNRYLYRIIVTPQFVFFTSIDIFN